MGYCDNTMLIEKIIERLNKLVDICEDYSKKWMLKYNIKKSVIINCGKNIYKDEEIDIKMNGIRLPVVEMSKYLGVEINKKNDDNSQIINKFRKVQKGFYGLSSFGIKPPGLQPKVKAFLYITYCKPMGTYGMGVMNLKGITLQQLNITQNNLIS